MFGPHVNRSAKEPGGGGGMAAHVEAARRVALAAGVRMQAAALFVGPPRSLRVTLAAAEAAELAAYLRRTGVRAVAHSAYVAAPWGGSADAARHIRAELAACDAAGVEGLVVHLPKLPVADVLQFAARLLNPDAPNVRVFLETPAVRPSESHYETPEKLEALFRGLRALVDPRLDRFGLCVDTAHLWTCGVDVRSREAAAAWLGGLEAVAETIPPDRVMLHLNDSARPRGVGPDTHAPLAGGQIWGDLRGDLAASGLAAFVDYATRHDTLTILERAKSDDLPGDYHILRDLAPGVRAAD
jgi:endonuclease IV